MSSNSISLAGEFAVLSQLSLLGYDANMMLGNTKGVDILVSDPTTHKMYQLEVKTHIKAHTSSPHESKIHGKFVSDWIMNKKHESISRPDLFYCFVDIDKKAQSFRFFIVPSEVVATYVRVQHEIYLDEKRRQGNRVKDSEMRTFRIGFKNEEYPLTTPTVEKYENNWEFKN